MIFYFEKKLCLLLILMNFIPIYSIAESLKGTRPNIILILSDDMGYSDLGCYGGEIMTPNLDKMAAEGIRYSQFYNSARCCPTRASLLTGLHPHQTGIGWMTHDRKRPGYEGDLNDKCLTIAEVLKTAGYKTYLSGKWHLTKHLFPKEEKDKYNWPLQRGFDRFYGTILGAGSLWDPTTLARGNKLITPVNDTEYEPNEPWFYTDAISDNAVKFIDEHRADSPFFMYVAYTAAHWPMHARERDISKYKGHYDAGFEAIRKERWKKLIQLGLIDEKWKLPDGALNWSDVDNKPWEARNMEVYAAMVDSMDQGIGRIINALKKKQQLENTLILFLQDNGGCAETRGRQGTPKPRLSSPTLKPMGADELQKRMVPRKTRDGYPVRQGVGTMAGAADTYISYGEGWANVSNTPFREYKHYTHEGGISTPLIAFWPKGILLKNKIEHQPGHIVDIMATCVDLAGTKYPSEFRGKAVTPLQGVSLSPTFSGKRIERKTLFFEHEGSCAIRKGKWKLVAKGNKGPRGNWELYNMESDRTELNNLADANPELVIQLAKEWEDWAKKSMVYPSPFLKELKSRSYSE